MIRSASLALGLSLLICAPAPAAQTPKPVAADARIRTVAWDPDQVVELQGYFDFQLMLEFGPGERIENVSIGDGLAWQVTPNKRANLLFLKPVDAAEPTNMTVVTDQRRYAFRLSARKAKGVKPDAMAYVVRFLYPPEPAPPPMAPERHTPPERRNAAYAYIGSTANLPSQVFDDGRFTYFKWPEATPTPALFLGERDGSESIVNYGVRDGFVVVEQLAPRFVLRNGKEVTTLVNEGWQAPAPGPSAPRPFDPKASKAKGESK